MTKRLLLAIAGLSLYVFATPCPTATVQDYLNTYNSKANACTEDPFTVHVSLWSSSSGLTPDGLGHYVPIGASDVTLSPPAPGTFGLNLFSSLFTVSNFDRIRVKFNYTIDPRPPILDGFSVSLDPGEATITADLCVGGLFGPGCVNQQTVEVTTANPLQKITFPAPVNILDVQMTIELKGNGDPNPTHIDGILSGASVVPEPASGFLVIGGLAGALVFRSRRSRLS